MERQVEHGRPDKPLSTRQTRTTDLPTHAYSSADNASVAARAYYFLHPNNNRTAKSTPFVRRAGSAT